MNKFSTINVHSKSAHTILSSALSWFGLGVAIVMCLGYGYTAIPFMQNIFNNIARSRFGFIGLSVVAIAVMLTIMFGVWKLSLKLLISLFLVFCIVQSFYIAYIFIIYANNLSKLLLVFAIPSFTFLLMGILGYFQVFNFGKIWKFLLFATIGLFVFGIALFFIRSTFLIKVYSAVGYIIFSLYVGYDLWRISRMQQFYDAGLELSKEAITRYGLIFGLSLLIDFIQLVWFMARMLR